MKAIIASNGYMEKYELYDVKSDELNCELYGSTPNIRGFRRNNDILVHSRHRHFNTWEPTSHLCCVAEFFNAHLYQLYDLQLRCVRSP